MSKGSSIQIGKTRIQSRSERHALGQAQVETGPVMDIYDGAEWTEMDILKAEIAAGRSIYSKKNK
jgi:hypothetical protein